MTTPPPELTRGPKWARKAYNALRDYAIASHPINGMGTQCTYDASGTAINATQSWSTIDLEVCIDGVPKIIAVYVKAGPYDPP